MKEALQPADQLRLGDTEFRFGRYVPAKRQGHTRKLFYEIGRERTGKLLYRQGINLAQSFPASVINLCGAGLVEQGLNHRSDSHYLGGLRDVIRLTLYAQFFSLGTLRSWSEHFVRVQGGG